MVQGFNRSVYSVALSPSEKMVAVAGDFKSIYVYDIDQKIEEFLY